MPLKHVTGQSYEANGSELSEQPFKILVDRDPKQNTTKVFFPDITSIDLYFNILKVSQNWKICHLIFFL